jgi:MFS transporter, MFS domain-containing protein family, molybdate-anion transporter
MTGFLVVTFAITSFYTPEDEKQEDSKKTTSTTAATSTRNNLHKEFDAFRHKYIMVYLVIMLADWMQGTHMYTLYLSYEVNVSALFLTGFLSGAIFAPFLGSFVDKLGRKNSCIVYCVLEIIINTLEHSHNFTILLIGRVLGGISTNLLFSAFESWMATEHRKKGFPEEWMSRTYSEVSTLMHIMAVILGCSFSCSWLMEPRLSRILHCLGMETN